MNQNFFPNHKDEGEVIAVSGEAKLIKHWEASSNSKADRRRRGGKRGNGCRCFGMRRW